MNSLMEWLEIFHCYLDDLLILPNGLFKGHLNKIDEVMKRLQSAGLKVYAKKYEFVMTKLEHLGFIISCKGIKSMANRHRPC